MLQWYHTLWFERGLRKSKNSFPSSEHCVLVSKKNCVLTSTTFCTNYESSFLCSSKCPWAHDRTTMKQTFFTIHESLLYSGSCNRVSFVGQVHPHICYFCTWQYDCILSCPWQSPLMNRAYPPFSRIMETIIGDTLRCLSRISWVLMTKSSAAAFDNRTVKQVQSCFPEVKARNEKIHGVGLLI